MSLSEIYASNSYWINPLIGAIISISLFSVTYRRTISARKERAIHAHDEVVKILLRNLLTINRVLSIQEINRILQTKSREFKVRIEDLPDELNCISDLYTKVAEDEMLLTENKKMLLEKINIYIETAENEAPMIVETQEKPSIKTERLTSMSIKSFEVAISAISAAAGIIVAISLSLFSFTEASLTNQISMIAAIVFFIAASISVVAFLWWIIDQSKPSITSIGQDAISFETRISRMLNQSGYSVSRDALLPNIGEFDFILQKNDHTYLIELKLFRTYIPKSIILVLLSKGKAAKLNNKNYSLILVVNNLKFIGRGISELTPTWNYIFDESGLKQFLKSLNDDSKNHFRNEPL
jgi:hypothetical protein